jgi:tRNA (mo5U34)-methyltransferase
MSGLESKQTLLQRASAVSWYQSLDLPGGISTSGTFDTQDEIMRIPFPTSLEGQRCLDVATADGFWAFEMERRGAAEVVAIDLPADRQDWPGNTDMKPPKTELSSVDGFHVAHDALKSKVQRRELSVYDLDPQSIGRFDFVFMGSLLLHLRDPVGALAAIGQVLEGELLSVDAISPPLTILHPRQPIARLQVPGWPLWWGLNLQAYRKLFSPADLEILATGRPFFVKAGTAYYHPGDQPSLYQRLSHSAATRFGNLHSWVRARAIRA